MAPAGLSRGGGGGACYQVFVAHSRTDKISKGEVITLMSHQKRRTEKDGDYDEEKPLFTLGQRIDKETLKKISMLEDVNEWELPVNALLQSCSLNRSPVEYMPGKPDKKGRPYGNGAVCNLPPWIMRLVSGSFYEFIGISTDAATILAQLTDREQASVPALFRRFANGGQEAVQKLLLEQVGKEDTPSNRTWAKKQLDSVIKQEPVLRNYAIDCPLMRDYSQACKSVGRELQRAGAFAEVWDLVKSLSDKPNKLTTFVSYIYQREELLLMMEVMSFLQSQGLYTGVFFNDQLLVESKLPRGGEKVFTDARLASVRAHVREVLGLDVEFHGGSYLPTVEDKKRLYGSVSLSKLPNDTERCFELLVRHGSANKLLRYEGYVLRPHAYIQGVYEYWQDYSTYAAEVLELSVNYTGNAVSSNNTLERYLERVGHPLFPLMTPSSIRSDWISFRNCSFNVKTLEYRSWDNFKERKEAPPFTDHWLDFEIDLTKLAEAANHGDEWLTPLWSQMLKLQLSEEMCYVFELLVGRLMYRLGEYDNWQVMPFIVGDAGTSKGTVLEIISLFKPQGKVGFMSKNMEDKFGLQGLYQKELVMCMDLPQNFASVLDQSIMQSCISGEGVAVPIKYKTAVTDRRWSTPCIMAGSCVLNYNDEQGLWKRRLALFLWLQTPDHVRSDLKRLIAQNELPYILLRGIARYRKTVQEKPGADFWRDIAPAELQQNQRYTESRMNVLARFLHEGSREHGVIPDKGRLTEWSTFVSVYANYLKELKQSYNKAARDVPLAALHGNGYKVFPPRRGSGAGSGSNKKDQRVNFCAYCPRSQGELGHQCNPAGICREGLCGYVNCKDEQHKGAGRLKAYGIVNMRIVPRAEFDRWLNSTEASSESKLGESSSESPREDLSVGEWQERLVALAEERADSEKIRHATEEMLRAERRAERRRVCEIAGIKNWNALKKKYKKAQKRKGQDQQAQELSSKKPRALAEEEAAEKYPLVTNE